MRPHGISLCSFLVYLSGLRIRVTVAFWTLLPVASSSACCAFVPASCSSGYDFAIPSSRLFLTEQTLGVAFEFVGNYASMDFHHRALTCPSYNKNPGNPGAFIQTESDFFHPDYTVGSGISPDQLSLADFTADRELAFASPCPEVFCCYTQHCKPLRWFCQCVLRFICVYSTIP